MMWLTLSDNDISVLHYKYHTLNRNIQHIFLRLINIKNLNMKKIQFLQLFCSVFIIFAIATFAQSNTTTSGSSSSALTGSSSTQCFTPFVPGSNPGPIIGLPLSSTTDSSSRLLQQANGPVKALKNFSTNYE